MCLNALRIPNKTRRFVNGLSRPWNTVKCGHCAECAKEQQDDWFVRAIFEQRRVESKGGSCWVPILTYRNEDLPMYHDDEFNYHIPCFDKVHVKRFRDRLRVYLKRHGYKCSGDLTIRYISCTEYGDEKGRSHLHVNLYVPFYVPAGVMKKAIDFAWTYGYVRYSKKGMMAIGLRAARYAMKYISKDMCWSDKYGTDKYEAKLKEFMYSSKTPEEYEHYHEKLKAFRRVKPSHLQSMGFGVDGVNYFRNPDGSFNYDRCLFGVIDGGLLGVPPTKKGDVYQYNMPLYYVRKIFYNIDEWQLYQMSEFGKEIFAARFALSLKREAERYQCYFDKSTFMAHVAPLVNCPGIEFNADEVYSHVKDLTSFIDYSDLALFNKVYRDISFSRENEEIFNNVRWCESGCALDYLRHCALDFMLKQKSIDIDPTPKNSYNPNNKVISDFCFNNLDCFVGFNDLLLTIEDIERKLGKLEQLAADIERIRDRNLSVYCDNYISSNDLFV